MKNFMKSIEKFFKDFNIQTYIYTDTFIDVSQVYNCNPDNDLDGSETTFTPIDTVTGLAITNTTYTDYLKYRYISLDTGEFIKIIAYDNITGEITLEKPIGEALSTTDTFDIVVLDSCFIELGNDIQDGMSNKNRRITSRVYLNLDTKQDSDKSKMYTYQQDFRNAIDNGMSKIPLYDDSLAVILDYADITTYIDYVKKVNADTQIQSYLGSFMIEYRYIYI